MPDPGYVAGWNDTAHGIITFSHPTETYESPQEWADSMKRIATECEAKCKNRNVHYFKGVINCVTQYRSNNAIHSL